MRSGGKIIDWSKTKNDQPTPSPSHRWQAGRAGISKEIPDRLQNHALQDVSSKSYDRWHYMPQKRAAMKKWDAYVRTLLARNPLELAA